VRVLDAQTGKQTEYSARVIFLCASTFGSTFIMMNSISSRFPSGFGNDSGELGCNIMDHHLGAGASAQVEGFDDRYYFGRRPNGFYIPRYRNLGNERRDYLRGFGYQGRAARAAWNSLDLATELGEDLKKKAQAPGPWSIAMGGFGEILPYYDNRVTIDRAHKDKYGLPILAFDARLRDNELRMRKDMINDAAEMLEAAGYRDVHIHDDDYGVGLGIHEMGAARMGRDPKTSVLNSWNQVHACKNVYVTDGSCMTSSACQNPSLTYMALTARAANHAVEELKRMNI
jgi:choline dehydrogenase-like flavoprotein